MESSEAMIQLQFSSVKLFLTVTESDQSGQVNEGCLAMGLLPNTMARTCLPRIWFAEINWIESSQGHQRFGATCHGLSEHHRFHKNKLCSRDLGN